MEAVVRKARTIESVSPFRRSPEVRDAIGTAVTGRVPEWLQGGLVRTCPAVFEGGRWQAGHWFDGLCMIYAFRIGGGAVTFQSRLLESEAAHEIAEGPALLGSFGTATGRTWWQRVVQPVQGATDNTNVNVVRMGDDLVALTEGERQVRLDAQSLRLKGIVSYAQNELAGAIMSAHPQFDFARGKVVNVATQFGAAGVVSIYEHGGGERSRKVVGSWRTSRVPYTHTFGLSPAHAILVAHPLSAKPYDMLWSNRGYIDHFDWRPQDGTRLVRINRATGAIAEYETDPMFVFHTVNSFERGRDTILDLLAHRSAEINIIYFQSSEARFIFYIIC